MLFQQDIRNLIWVPLVKDGVLNGCIGLDNYALDKSNMIVPFLQTIQYFVNLTIQRNENEKKLFELSFLDKLTSFYNRNCFIQDVSEFKKRKESVGVVYLDINGLKKINDCFGHDAGDNLIKECANIMKSSSNSKHLYRIGGDEFVIIYLGISEQLFYDSVQKIKNNFQNSECQIAIGCKWSKSCIHIQDIIKTADELMYGDKKEFYKEQQTTNH